MQFRSLIIPLLAIIMNLNFLYEYEGESFEEHDLLCKITPCIFIVLTLLYIIAVGLGKIDVTEHFIHRMVLLFSDILLGYFWRITYFYALPTIPFYTFILIVFLHMMYYRKIKCGKNMRILLFLSEPIFQFMVFTIVFFMP